MVIQRFYMTNRALFSHKAPLYSDIGRWLRTPSVPGVAMAKFAGDENYRHLRMKSSIVSAVFGEACIKDSAVKYFQESRIQNTFHVVKKNDTDVLPVC